MEAIQHLLGDELILSLSKTLLHFVWQGAGLAVALYVVLKLVGNQYSRLRYLSGLTILGLVVVAPVITFFHLYDAASVSNNLFVADSQSIISANSVMSEAFFDWSSLLPVVSISWLLGVCWFSAQLIYEVHKVKLLPRYGTSPVDEHIQVLFDRLVVQLKASKVTRLMASTRAEVPMVIGWLRPVVLVPASMITGLTPVQLEMLLAHELAHVRRHDYLINFFQNLVEVLFFFHPCVKWISNQIRIEREFCCDDIAVSCCGNPMAYARALTNAELIRRDNIPQLAMAATGGNLKTRVMRLVSHQDCSANQSSNWLSQLFAGLAGISLVLFFASAPQLATADSANASRKQSLVEPLLDEVEDAQIQVSEDNDNIQTQQDPEAFNTEKNVEESVLPEEPAEFENNQKDGEGRLDQSQVVMQTVVEDVNTVNNEKDQRISIVDTETAVARKPAEVNLEDEPDIIKQDKVPVVDKVSSLNQPLIAEVEKAQVNYENVIVNPKLLHAVAPKYPRSAQRRQLETEFSVTFNVNEEGRVVDIQFNDDVKNLFKRPVKFALKKWRFEPGTVDGKTSTVQMTRVFSFTNPSNERVYLTGSRLPVR